MQSAPPTRDDIVAILDGVKDPEVPVLSVVELGIVRDVRIADGEVVVVVTPTYSGCPAMRVIEDDILTALREHGIVRARMETTYTPAWTTDWIGAAAREKLRAFGIAPPGRALAEPLVTLQRRREAVVCPWCGSRNTVLQSEFSSTACKAMHVCNSCRQPFEEFKAI